MTQEIINTKHQPSTSFPETADIESSSDDYAGRFAGAVGQWMLDVQERGVFKLLRDVAPGASILDIGGGHGQLAIPLARAGYNVTVLGSDPVCAKRIQALIDDGTCSFVVGNVIDLPFDDRAFDVVLSFRMLTHCTAWPTLIREMCRVTRGPVVLDYPTSQSVNAIAPFLFGAKKKVESNTRTWRLFKHREVFDVFEKNGFTGTSSYKQFFLPMVLHRMMKSRGLSSSMEGICRALELTRLAGSPVIARFDRS